MPGRDGVSPPTSRASSAAWDWPARRLYVVEAVGMGWAPGSLDSIAAPVGYQPFGVACDEGQDGLHRVDTYRPGEEAGVGYEKARRVMELPEARHHSAAAVLAHPRRAHQMHGEKLYSVEGD